MSGPSQPAEFTNSTTASLQQKIRSMTDEQLVAAVADGTYTVDYINRFAPERTEKINNDIKANTARSEELKLRSRTPGRQGTMFANSNARKPIFGEGSVI